MGSVWERYGLLWVRIYLGAFNFFSGLNYFIHIWPQPQAADSVTGRYVEASMEAGLFTMAKVIELVTGFLLLTNIAVPFALVMLMPVTVTIFIMNTFQSYLPHVKASGIRNFLFHIILLGAYAGHYYPMLKLRSEPSPFWRKPSALKDFL